MSKKFTGAVYFSIKNKLVAKTVIDHLVTSEKDYIILPFSDYPGAILSEILRRRYHSLTICENDDFKRTQLKNHIEASKSIINTRVIPDNLFDLSFKTHSDIAQKRCAAIAQHKLPDGHSTVVKFLVPLLKKSYESAFLKNLYYQMSCKLGLCSGSLLHYYFLMSDRQHQYLSAVPSENMRLYRSTTVLYNTIFNVRTLESFDLKSSFGISLRKLQNTSANNSQSYRNVHLVWLEPRLDVINQMDCCSLLEFRFLVTQMMHKRTGSVQKFLEKFFNNFKNDLNNLGIDDQVRCGDLTKEQYLRLFKYLRCRHDYSTSTFLQAVATDDTSLITMSC